jgi:hypothetical protein
MIIFKMHPWTRVNWWLDKERKAKVKKGKKRKRKKVNKLVLFGIFPLVCQRIC